VIRQRAIVKDVLFPFLVKKTKSVTEAKRLCHEVSTALQQEFQKKIAEKQNELSNALTSTFVIENITKKDKKDFKLNQELVALFKDEKLSLSNALIGGMVQAIDSFVNEEINGRSLESLKTTFL
jgi:methionine salvage enolase-phosphatase E1